MYTETLLHYASEAGELNEITPQEYSETYATEFRKNTAGLLRGIALAESVENLNHKFSSFEASATTAKQYQIAVAGLFHTAGLQHLPARMIAPSFESADYSTEAEEKKQSLLARIWEWIKEAGKRFIEGLRKLLGMRIHHAVKVDADLAKLKEIIGQLSDKKVKPFKMSYSPFYGIDQAGKFAVAMNNINDFTRPVWSAVNKIGELQRKIVGLKPMELQGVTSSKDIYDEIYFNKPFKIDLVYGAYFNFDPANHYVVTVDHSGRGVQIKETTPLSIEQLKVAVIAQEALQGDQKRLTIEADKLISTFSSLLKEYESKLNAANTQISSWLESVRRDVFKSYGLSLGTLDLMSLRPSNYSDEDHRHADMAKKELAALGAAAADKRTVYNGYKFIINAFTKLSTGIAIVDREVDSFQRDCIRLIKANVECYTIYKKAEKPAK